jgi:hypothetical protein
MARRPEDPRVTDLRRYRRAREAQARRAQRPVRSREPLLGGRPRAGLILAVVILIFLALSVGPSLL